MMVAVLVVAWLIIGIVVGIGSTLWFPAKRPFWEPSLDDYLLWGAIGLVWPISVAAAILVTIFVGMGKLIKGLAIR